MSSSMRGRASLALVPRTRIARVFLAIAVAGLAATACDVHGISAPGSLSALTVTPNPVTLAVNGTQQFTATGTDFSGARVAVNATWSIVSGGGTISATGLFTAGTVPGTFASTVKATDGSVSNTATVIVTAGPLASIVVTPNPMSLAIGGTQQYTAVGRDASGNVVAFTPSWSVVAGGGTVSATGLFTAGTVAGTFVNTVQASSGTLRGTATVTVTAGPLATIVVTPNPATLGTGATQQFTATGRDASGNAVAITPVWSVVAGGGTIASTGLFTAGTTAGTFTNTVRATSGTVSGLATVVVTAGAVATITVTPNPATLAIGATQQFTATGSDANGNAVAVTPSWSVVSGGGTIDIATGLFTAGNTSGTFTNTVRASVGGVVGSATVVVTPGPLATITVTPNPATLQTGATQQFTAVGRDASGNVVGITPAWTVAAGGGTINASTGLFTAGTTAGTFTNTVRATVGGVVGSATVVVTPGPLATITVTPNPATVAAGATQQFTAVGTDANGNVVAISPAFSVVNGGGTINASTGLFTAGAVAGTFTNTVQATSGGISGTATVIVTVPAPVVATITVTPNPATVPANGVQQFVAVGRDANGVIVPITPVWAVVAGGGTINASTGQFTAGAVAGTFTNTVQATSGSVSGTATVIVTAPVGALASITVAPNPATVMTNGTQLFTAIGRDANGLVVPITPVWAVVAGGGTINASTGLFTAGAVAGTFTNTVRATSGSISGTATVTVTAVVPPPLINLGTAAPNGIMAGTAVTCISGGIINADVAISPGNTITGFGPCVITGVQNLGNAIAAQAQIDLATAYNQLAGLPCPPANAIVANLGGTTKAAGVYCTASGIGITGILTLDGGGDPNATFVFQAGTTLTTAGNIVLINGAQAKNVYFQVGSSATLGTASQIQGNILALTSITLVDNATLIGRALARNGAVSLGSNNVITLP